ncbi:hypothetical protein [Hoeflea sp.]|uniref:hypothetical protein n=1 Tax=Hoeflea sp. TaxID=1940281 RepID=UPI003BB0E163
MKFHQVVVAACSSILLAGCVQDTGRGTAPGTPSSTSNVTSVPTPMSRTGSTAPPSLAEQGCLRDVTRTTNNPDVVLLSSEFSQAGTQVIVGVGPQRARWSCIGYSDGSTAEIVSLTDEGSL